MDFGQTIITDMKAMICNTTGTTYTMATPILERKMREVMLLDFFLTGQLRIQHTYRSTNSCFLMLLLYWTNGRILNSIMMNVLGTYGNRNTLSG